MRKNETQNQNIRFTSRRPEYVPIQCFDQTEGAKPRRSALERHCDICFHCHHADCGGYSHLHGYLEDPGHHHSPGGHPHHAHWFYFLFAIKVARQWEKGVVLRMGRFHGLKGPGFFMIVPIIDTVPLWIDQRVMVTPFSAEKTLTRDTVPVNVDAGALLGGVGC